MGKDRTEMHDLSATEPETASRLAEAWEAWAIEAKAKPWPWDRKKKAATGSNKKRFNLAAGADLPGESAPDIGGKPFRFEVEVKKPGEGVILAQGGVMHGYALTLDSGQRPVASLRYSGKLITLKAAEPAPGKPFQTAFDLSPNGDLSVSIDGKEVIQGEGVGLLHATPGDGLQVGFDGNDAVGEYPKTSKFTGEIGAVTLKVGAGKKK
jgi:arylsulfatase